MFSPFLPFHFHSEAQSQRTCPTGRDGSVPLCVDLFECSLLGAVLRWPGLPPLGQLCVRWPVEDAERQGPSGQVTRAPRTIAIAGAGHAPPPQAVWERLTGSPQHPCHFPDGTGPSPLAGRCRWPEGPCALLLTPGGHSLAAVCLHTAISGCETPGRWVGVSGQPGVPAASPLPTSCSISWAVERR